MVLASNLFNTPDIKFQTNTQIFSIIEQNKVTLELDLPCSSSGSTSISFSLSGYNRESVPSFVSIDSLTGILNVDTPSIAKSTQYSFYVDSTIIGAKGPVHKIIKLNILKCTASNCQKCSSTDTSAWAICNSGYDFISGIWSLPQTQTIFETKASTELDMSKLINIAIKVLVGVAIGVSIVLWMLDISSLASLYSLINQSKILFFLLLTRTFISKDIQNMISGLKICLNPFYYISGQNSFGLSRYVYNSLNFGLSDSNLDLLGVVSDSIIDNILPIVIFILVLILFQVWITLLLLLIEKLLILLKRYKQIAATWRFLYQKIISFLNFGLYIRFAMEMYQFILICSINEIYNFRNEEAKMSDSLTISIVIFALWVLLIGVISGFAYFYKEDENVWNRYAQFFEGISKQRKHRFYIAIQFIRRLIYVVLLFTVAHKSPYFNISVLIGLQLIYLSILIVMRPFIEIKINLIEIISEANLLTLLILLLFFNLQDRWTNTYSITFMWIILSNFIASFIIIIGKTYFSIHQKQFIK